VAVRKQKNTIRQFTKSLNFRSHFEGNTCIEKSVHRLKSK